eukprot:SAG11_NODE_4944_length_1714_cov_4.650155_3_plen_192_part_00
MAAPEDLPNGIALNQRQPDVTIPLLAGNDALPPAFSTVLKNIDDINFRGLHETELSWPRDRFMILSDTFQTVSPETSTVGAGVADPDQVLFRDIIKKFNWTMNKQYKLQACTAMADATQGAEYFTPANVPGNWIPFVQVACLNISTYDNVLSMPTFKFAENTFFIAHNKISTGSRVDLNPPVSGWWLAILP